MQKNIHNCKTISNVGACVCGPWKTHNERVRGTDAVKSVIESFKLAIDSTVQQIVNILLNIFCKTTTIPVLIISATSNCETLPVS